MAFVCHVPLQDQVSKVFYDFLFKSPSREVTVLPSLMTIGTVLLDAIDFRLSRDLTRQCDQRVM